MKNEIYVIITVEFSQILGDYMKEIHSVYSDKTQALLKIKELKNNLEYNDVYFITEKLN